MKLIDRTGNRYGHLKVLRRAQDKIFPSGKKGVVWECLCDCGERVNVLASNLQANNTRSCGCASKTMPNLKHGDCRNKNITRLWRIWMLMKERCNNNDSNYGGRGIKVCEEWNEYDAFKAWAMSNGYKENLSIDRIDVDGNYEPDNCRWADRETQANNKRNNRYVTISGVKKSVSMWSKESGIASSTIIARLNRGWNEYDAVFKQLQR